MKGEQGRKNAKQDSSKWGINVHVGNIQEGKEMKEKVSMYSRKKCSYITNITTAKEKTKKSSAASSKTPLPYRSTCVLRVRAAGILFLHPIEEKKRNLWSKVAAFSLGWHKPVEEERNCETAAFLSYRKYRERAHKVLETGDSPTTPHRQFHQHDATAVPCATEHHKSRQIIDNNTDRAAAAC
jgi:hypothetical protein